MVLSQVISLSTIAITERCLGLARVSRLAQLTLKLTQRGFWAQRMGALSEAYGVLSERISLSPIELNP